MSALPILGVQQGGRVLCLPVSPQGWGYCGGCGVAAGLKLPYVIIVVRWSILKVVIKWPRNRGETLRYLCGLVKGDGCFEDCRVEIYDSNKEFLNSVAAITMKYYGNIVTSITIEYRSKYKVYRVRFYGRNFSALIRKNITKTRSLNYIRGVFDAEGSIWRNPNLVAEITNKDYKLLHAIRNILNKYRINSKIHPDRNTYKLRITSLRKFIEIFGLRHPKHIIKISPLPPPPQPQARPLKGNVSWV